MKNTMMLVALLLVPAFAVAQDAPAPAAPVVAPAPADPAVLPAISGTADAPLPPSTGVAKYDPLALKFWTQFTASPNFHNLDNATAGYFYDFINKQNIAGITTSVYQKNYVSADWGVAGEKTPNGSSSGANAYSGFPLVAVNFHGGQLLAAKYPQVVTLVTSLGVKDGSILTNATAGGWAARDFNAGVWRGGVFTAFKFGAVSN
jgi:hypothetical protein